MQTMTVKEVAELSGWSVRYVRHLCKTGVIGEAYSNGSGKRMTCVPFPGKVFEILGKEKK